jgi:hypothetical protein
MKIASLRVGKQRSSPLSSSSILGILSPLFSFFILISFFVPLVGVRGQTQPPPTNPAPPPIRLENPISINDIAEFLKKLIDLAIMIGIPIAVLFIIYTGFLFVSAQGRPEKLRDARRALLAVVIGVAILLGAWVIATAIKGTIDAIRGGP